MRAHLCCLALLFACRRDAQQSPPVAAAHAAADAGALEGESGAVLLESRGAVELQRSGGQWTRATRGDRIRENDGLRTPADAQADLSVDGVRVRLYDRSELQLSVARPGRMRGKVRGRVESDVVAQKGQVSLQVADTTAEATSDGGHFFVTADGEGAVAVAATTGTVRIAGSGRDVALSAGQVTHLERGAPVQPTEALEKVLLTVQWPATRTNRPTVPLAGHVSSGSRVYVQGEPVDVGADGEFKTDVRLHEGRQKVAVVTVDPLGRREEVAAHVVRDTSRPDVQVTTPWQR